MPESTGKASAIWPIRARYFGGPLSHQTCTYPSQVIVVLLTSVMLTGLIDYDAAKDGYQMLYKTLSAAVYGIDANLIEVEVDVTGITSGQEQFSTVGLPDATVRESRQRVQSALKNCGYDIPASRITINLAPADIKKEGSGFDLPM